MFIEKWLFQWSLTLFPILDLSRHFLYKAAGSRDCVMSLSIFPKIIHKDCLSFATRRRVECTHHGSVHFREFSRISRLTKIRERKFIEIRENIIAIIVTTS